MKAFFRSTCGVLFFIWVLLHLNLRGGDLPAQAQRALGGGEKAIAILRESGQSGLDDVLPSKPELLAALRSNRLALDDAEAIKYRKVIDAVARQRDAFASGLYW